MNANNTEQNIALKMAKITNYKTHAEILSIPTLNIFERIEEKDPQTILIAKGKGFIEQLVSDGYIDEEIDERIKLVIEKTNELLKINGLDNTENTYIYYKDYNNGTFNFKIYVQDIIVNTENKNNILRTFTAFFIEPKMKDFYQFSLSADPKEFPNDNIEPGKIDLSVESTKALDDIMTLLLKGLTYKTK